MTKQYFIDKYVVKQEKTLENLIQAIKAAEKQCDDGSLDEKLTLEDLRPFFEDSKTNVSVQQFRELEDIEEWNAIDKTNYYEMQKYKMLHPDSAYYDEMETMMWNLVKQNPCDLLPLYPIDFPDGKYTDTAKKYESFRAEWMEFKSACGVDLLVDMVLICKVDYLNKVGKDNPFYDDVQQEYAKLKNDALDSIAHNPGGVSKGAAIDLIRNGIFSLSDLINRNAITEESWEYLNNFSDENLPWGVTSSYNSRSIVEKAYRINEGSDLSKYKGATDVFFFGFPCSGKTSILMGLSGLDAELYAGPDDYLADLHCFLSAQLGCGATYAGGVYVSRATLCDGKWKGAEINLVDMAGEDFLYKLAFNQGYSLDQGYYDLDYPMGVNSFLNSNNRKVFFFVVDPTKDYIKVHYERMGKGDDIVYLKQDQILQTFCNCLHTPQFTSVMNKVDAIHIVVTKVDTLANRDVEAFLKEKYAGLCSLIQNLCSRYARKRSLFGRNKDVYHEVVGFSLGKIYIGDIFDYDKSYSQNILELIKNSISVK